MKLTRVQTLFIMILMLGSSFSNMAHAQDTNPQLELEQFMQRHHGKVIYLDFWASWCVPCRKSFPWMNAMKANYQDQGLVIISVNLDVKRSFADKFLQEVPAKFSVIYDAKGILAKKFKLKGMPSSYLFDRQGKLISAHSGFSGKKKQRFEQEIKKALL